MTSPRKERSISPLRSRGQDTHGCVPVRGPVGPDHAAVSGDAAKVRAMTSLRDMGEATMTAEAQAKARTRRSAGAVDGYMYREGGACSPHLKAGASAPKNW
jgi:hypothetical protein